MSITIVYIVDGSAGGRHAVTWLSPDDDFLVIKLLLGVTALESAAGWCCLAATGRASPSCQIVMIV